jgi:hypothetical protein
MRVKRKREAGWCADSSNGAASGNIDRIVTGMSISPKCEWPSGVA